MRVLKKKLKNLISANKIDNYNRGGEKKRKKSLKKIPKNLQNKRISQSIRITNVFLESLLSESFPSPP